MSIDEMLLPWIYSIWLWIFCIYVDVKPYTCAAECLFENGKIVISVVLHILPNQSIQKLIDFLYFILLPLTEGGSALRTKTIILFITLPLFTTLDNNASLSNFFKLSKKNLSRCLEELCSAIIKELHEEINVSSTFKVNRHEASVFTTVYYSSKFNTTYFKETQLLSDEGLHRGTPIHVISKKKL